MHYYFANVQKHGKENLQAFSLDSWIERENKGVGLVKESLPVQGRFLKQD